jgi:hypothetical protein
VDQKKVHILLLPLLVLADLFYGFDQAREDLLDGLLGGVVKGLGCEEEGRAGEVGEGRGFADDCFGVLVEGNR